MNLIKYDINDFQNVNPEQKERIEFFRDIFPVVKDGWIAGGVLRRLFELDIDNSEKGDVDIFFKNEDALYAFLGKISAIHKPNLMYEKYRFPMPTVQINEKENVIDVSFFLPVDIQKSFASMNLNIDYPNLYSLMPIIQLVKKYYKSQEELLEDFDFSICQLATQDFKTIYTTDEALNDIVEKRLVKKNMPNCGYYRTFKFMGLGYKPEEKVIPIIDKQGKPLGIGTIIDNKIMIDNVLYEPSSYQSCITLKNKQLNKTIRISKDGFY